jgi:hypothetical protein
MAIGDKKTTELVELTTPAVGDILYVVDVSEALDDDKSKYMTFTTLDARYPIDAPVDGYRYVREDDAWLCITGALDFQFSHNAVFLGVVQ